MKKKPKKPKVSVFLHHPYCSAHCAVSIHEALWKKYNVELFQLQDLHKPKTLRGTKIILFPGGAGDSQKFQRDIVPHKEPILEYMDKRGKYLGICMGAYWAGSLYFDLLKNLDAVQYIKRPRADVRRSHGTTAEVDWLGQTTKMYFYDGCAIVGNGRSNVIATYKNGDTMACIQNRVGVIGCHPESLRSWYQKPFIDPFWHRGHHHKLLLNFTDMLMEV